MRVGYTPKKESTYLKTVEKAFSKDADAIQLWTGSPYKNVTKYIDTKDCEATKSFVNKNNIHLISHSPYVINFARDNQKDSQKRLAMDLENIYNLGGTGTVLHTGKNVKEINQTFKQAEENFTENIRKTLESVDINSFILLENMCGSGTSMWCDMKSWSEYWNDYPYKQRTRWCIDTAHLYAAGEYDISKRKESFRFYNDFNEKIGWEYVDCIHFNGSLVPFGAKNDRHADIVEPSSGCIATKGLRQLARIAFANRTPLIMETPGVEDSMQSQIQRIRDWR